MKTQHVLKIQMLLCTFLVPKVKVQFLLYSCHRTFLLTLAIVLDFHSQNSCCAWGLLQRVLICNQDSCARTIKITLLHFTSQPSKKKRWLLLSITKFKISQIFFFISNGSSQIIFQYKHIIIVCVETLIHTVLLSKRVHFFKLLHAHVF